MAHPNTVYVFGSEEIDGIPVIAMELVAGGTLTCAAVTKLGTACGWKQSERYVEAVLTGWQPGQGSALMRSILDAIVLPG